MIKAILISVAATMMFTGWARANEVVKSTGALVGNPEYKQTLVLEGKWGEDPGEFGTRLVGETVYQPNSLSVDSLGNIYILDTPNNRIQNCILFLAL